MNSLINITHDFLVEIGTEELPPKALKMLSEAFSSGIQLGLEEAEISFAEVGVYASPRRLAVRIQGLQSQQADKIIEKKGPAKKAAFDVEGNPSKALQGFSRGCGVSPDELSEIETSKGTWMVYYQEKKGQAVADLLPDIVNKSLANLPIPKRMRWGSSDIEFVRPVHWVLMLLDESIVPANILGHQASNFTKGHRFHAPERIKITRPGNYSLKLGTQGFVVASFEERLSLIRQQVKAIATSFGGEAVIDEDLLEEVTALNEWPQAVQGDFDEVFLSVPAEALISAMKSHQKYFHVLDRHGKLMSKFITIANIVSSNPLAVKEGNERVIRPRLADAKFFWDQDRKHTLDDFLPRLKKVIFQQKLGSLFDKVERLESLTVKIAKPLGVASEIATRAARLSKSDLMSEMVGEFPDLQGIMGRYYATEQKENALVAEAIDEQYKPRFSGDTLPKTAVSQSLAIADKLDTITGIYGIGQVPTGDKDPFGLRRAALGLVRIIIESELDLDLHLLIKFSLDLHESITITSKLVNNIYGFIISRLKSYYADKGVSTEEFEAVRVCFPAHPLDFDKRLAAVVQFSKMPEAVSLSAANKRIANILKKSSDDIVDTVETSLFEEDAERVLFATLDDLRESVSELMAKRDYTTAMAQLAKIHKPVDDFFDGVMVMSDNQAVKNNRLALLKQIYQLFLAIADISRL